jgi:hypothetical protein
MHRIAILKKAHSRVVVSSVGKYKREAGEVVPPGVNLSPRGEVIPWG